MTLILIILLGIPTFFCGLKYILARLYDLKQLNLNLPQEQKLPLRKDIFTPGGLN